MTVGKIRLLPFLIFNVIFCLSSANSVILNESEDFWNFSGVYDFCEKNLCFRKCCNDNQTLTSSCQNQNIKINAQNVTTELWKLNIRNNITILNSNGLLCRNENFPIPVDISECILKGNKIHVSEYDEIDFYHNYTDFCFDFFGEENNLSFSLIVCYGSDSGESAYINGLGKSFVHKHFAFN